MKPANINVYGLRLTTYGLKARHIYYAAMGLLFASFLSYFSSVVQIVGFMFFSVSCLILGLWRREYALYLVFLELVLGSFGYLFSIPAGGINFSLRYAFFIIIMGLWVKDLITGYKTQITNDKNIRRTTIVFLFFVIFWIVGIVNGYARSNGLANIFFDANGYVFLLLIFPAMSWINSEEKIKNAVKIILSGALVSAFFTALLFVIFTNIKNPIFLEILYKWIRDFRIGEITPLDGGLYRIFLQSHIYPAIIFIFLFLLDIYRKINFRKYTAYALIIAGGVYISLSRSIWVGLVAGFFTSIVLLCYAGFKWKKISRFSVSAILLFATATLAVSFLSPKGTSLLSGRFVVGKSSDDTRISQLQVLVPAIRENLLFGYGFGKTLAFQSHDPRVAENIPGGLYTTYAFEWGYLDMLLKMGIFGTGAYIYFIYVIIRSILRNISAYKKAGRAARNEPLAILDIWAISAVITVATTNIFTPYLNHPLGIGILVLGATLAHLDSEHKL